MESPWDYDPTQFEQPQYPADPKIYRIEQFPTTQESSTKQIKYALPLHQVGFQQNQPYP